MPGTAAAGVPLSEIEALACGVAHDMEEPLRMVAGYTHLLECRYRGKLDSDADAFLRYAHDGACRMQRMVAELLEYVRLQSGTLPLFPVESECAMEGAVENLWREIEDSRAVVTHGPLPCVLADESQLTRVFQNIIANAIKYREKKTPRIRVTAARRAKMWEFTVRDNGVGIPPQDRKKVFALFGRLDASSGRPGLGIGLATCRRIVELCGGSIRALSRPGRGAAILFSLPAAASDRECRGRA